MPVELGLIFFFFFFFFLGNRTIKFESIFFFWVVVHLSLSRMVCTSLLAATPLWFIPDPPWVGSLFVFWWHFDSFTRQA